MEKKIGKDLKSISDELKSFRTKSDSISNAKSLINNCKPYLQNIKNQLGSTDDQYLLISSAVANNALGMCIKVVNQAQSSFALSTTSLNTLKNTIKDALSAMKSIKSLDMNSQERSRFNENQRILNNICIQINNTPDPFTVPDHPVYRGFTHKECGYMVLIYLIFFAIFIVLLVSC